MRKLRVNIMYLTIFPQRVRPILKIKTLKHDSVEYPRQLIFKFYLLLYTFNSCEYN